MLAIIVVIIGFAVLPIINIPLIPYYGSTITVTNKRVMYIKRPWVRIEVRDFTFSEMSSVTQDSGLWYATVTIQLAGSGIQFTNILKEKAAALMNVIRDNISAPQAVSLDAASLAALSNIAAAGQQVAAPVEHRQVGSSAGAAPPQAISQSSELTDIDRLERLADSCARGILSDEEFEDEKAKVLRGG